MFIGFVSQAIEDHESMSLLCRSDRFGSAFKLARSTFDCLYRGVWLGSCATDDQIKSYIASDKFPVKMTQMAQDIDRHYSSAGSDEDFFVDFKTRVWSSLSSYEHTGMLQIARRFTGLTNDPAYTDVQVIEMSTTATTCTLTLIEKFLYVQDHHDSCLEVRALISSY